MERNNETRRAVFAELKDLLAGAAFPLMLMLIFCASFISYADYGTEVGLSVAAVVVGELFLIVAYIIFGRQSGITAYRRYILQDKKREIGTTDFKALHAVGEYALWKGFVIALISCLPYIVVQIIGSAAPNTVCDFLLHYIFGWAYFPLSFVGASTWLNLLWVIPLVCIHAGAYAYGGYREKERQKKVAEAEELRGKKGRK